MKTFNLITFILMVVGALNWGLVGFFNFNLVAFIFSLFTATVEKNIVLERFIYALVGLSALWSLRFVTNKKMRHAIEQ